jgi:hypothetical protein
MRMFHFYVYAHTHTHTHIYTLVEIRSHYVAQAGPEPEILLSPSKRISDMNYHTQLHLSIQESMEGSIGKFFSFCFCL